MKLWLNVREGAEYAGVCRDTVYAACERREIRHARVGGRRAIRLKPEWMDAWLERHALDTEDPQLQVADLDDMIRPIMRFEKIWVERCRATRCIKRHFGAKSALDYLVGEKLPTFAGAARHDAAFARELPRFLAAVWRVFNEYELAGYVAKTRQCASVSGRSSTSPEHQTW
jgi:excisionase family DNA binding protein